MPVTEATARWPNYREGDFLVKDYRFASGEVLPELRLHYRTMGTPQRGAALRANHLSCDFYVTGLRHEIPEVLLV